VPDQPRNRARRAVAMAGVLAASTLGAFAGCGSDSDELSEEELVAEGNEICLEAREAFAELQDAPPTTAREAADLTEQLLGIAEDELDQISALEPPSDLQDELDSYLAARERGIELLRDGLEAAESEDAAAYADAQAAIAAEQVERLELARAVGFTECSRPLGGERSQPQ
jgi:hypothetical protein